MKPDTIEDVLGSLARLDLGGLHPRTLEREIAMRLSLALKARFTSREVVLIPGLDGSARKPDHALLLSGHGQVPDRTVAVEYKVYRSRRQGTGELDRGLGQCFTFAEQYDAVVLCIVYMGAPQDLIPEHWARPDTPHWIDHGDRRVPLYVITRPLSWAARWASSFERRLQQAGAHVPR